MSGVCISSRVRNNNNVYGVFCLDVCQVLELFCLKTENFSRKVLVVRKKAVPLHPLSPKKLGRE